VTKRFDATWRAFVRVWETTKSAIRTVIDPVIRAISRAER
jgi:hypothetical protein